MKRLLIIILLLPTLAFAQDDGSEGPIKCDPLGDGASVALYLFNGANIGLAGNEECSGNANNDFAVASTNVPAYGLSGYGLAAWDYASDDGVAFSTDAFLISGQDTTLFSGGGTGEFTLIMIQRQRGLETPTRLAVHSDETSFPMGWNFGYYELPDVPSAEWGYRMTVKASTGEEFHERFTTGETSGADDDNYNFWCIPVDNSNAGGNDLIEIYRATLWDVDDESSDSSLLNAGSTHYGDNSAGFTAPLQPLSVGGWGIQSTVGNDELSMLQIFDSAQSYSWCNSYYQLVRTESEWAGRSRFIIN